MIPRTTVDIGTNELQAIKRVMERKQFVKGKECEFLEEEFSKYQRVKYGASVNSGTSALHISLLALDTKPGDEIITVPNTFAATVNSIIMVGAKPVFVDIDPKTFNIDISKIVEVITPKTKGIIPVHLYGLMAEVKPIVDLAEENNLFILEDACQSHGAEYTGKRAGSFGNAAAFSFFPTKNVTVGGDGGIVLSNNEEIIEKIKILRNHGRKNGRHICAGLNYRLSEILAAIGREHLKQLDTFNDHRRKIAKNYFDVLSDCKNIELPVEPPEFKHVYHLFTIKSEKRNELQKYLKKYKIASKIMYAERLNELKYIIEYAGKQSTPINRKINEQILSLPISGTLPMDKVERVNERIQEFFKTK